MDNNSKNNKTAFSFIDQGSFVCGEIQLDSPCEFGGSVKGLIESNSSVVISSTGQCEGRITAPKVELFGTLHADAEVHDLLVLRKGSTISGSVRCAQLEVEEGVCLNIDCNI
jgi:cytoskeletal protein CcmA (bactofilin family)